MKMLPLQRGDCLGIIEEICMQHALLPSAEECSTFIISTTTTNTTIIIINVVAFAGVKVVFGVVVVTSPILGLFKDRILHHFFSIGIVVIGLLGILAIIILRLETLSLPGIGWHILVPFWRLFPASGSDGDVFVLLI
jgi:hypothetical protein